MLGFYTDSTTPDARDLRAVRRYVARAASQFAVIVTMHLGAEGPTAQRTRNATERFLTRINRGNPVGFADAAFAGGATLVVGTGRTFCARQNGEATGSLSTRSETC